MKSIHLALSTAASLWVATAASATNPLVTDQFTADPTARVFEGKIYVYPSHDIFEPAGYSGRPNWFVMEDYHVFSSENLTDWKDHGVILSRNDVPWADKTAYAMWAPDAVFKDGKYFFYFPTMAQKDIGGGFRIGVAIGDTPTGPFKPLPLPIEGVRGIDPGVLLDKDGSAYLYWSGMNKLFAAKLKPDMTQIEGEPQTFDNLPKKGLQEGPFVFERAGTYYLTYPHVENKIERLEYATSTSPLGPFKWAGVILDESASGCWTVHHSILDYKGQWYLFYHDRDLSPSFDKRRSIRADKLFFNADGTIQKVTPTLRGVGVVKAGSKVQIDRYSAISPQGISVSFLDDANPHAGWKTRFAGANSWVRFDAVDFGRGRQKSILLSAKGPGTGDIEVRLDEPDGRLVARVNTAIGADWQTVTAAAKKIPAGVHDVFVRNVADEPIEIDWVSFR